MIKDLLQQLRTEVEQAAGLPDEAKKKLLAHLDDMTQEAGEEAGDKTRTQDAFQRLASSIEELEVGHPDVTNLIGRIAVVLSNMGI